MHVLLLSIGALLTSLSGPALPDTIILNAGKNSKVIFYGKSAQDLKDLEKLDLNKILKELNEKQSRTDSVPRQQVVMDGDNFMTPQLPKDLVWVQKYLANTFLNLHIGTGVHINRYVFYQPPSALLDHPTAQLSTEIVLRNPFTSSLSVVHDARFVDRPKFAVALRYGVGVGFAMQRYLHWNLLQSAPSDYPNEVVNRAWDLLRKEKVTPLQSDFNSFQTFFQLSPKISVKNKKGLSTFYLSLGARLNYNRNYESINPAGYASTLSVNSSKGGHHRSKGPIITGGGYGVYSADKAYSISYIAELGYKAIGVFFAYNSDYLPLHTRTLGSNVRTDSGFTAGQQGKLGYASFGIRLGR
ncbi:hypothetical protein [Telluribacter sp. SYSU D00476]|uniref:hypothetical protein n=1 Tax=Telluribacter sp. SYSU D00476 TaxID=2811430 RepID=UPI001FF3253F|nr:hypothetical protein [Telluribacter sp. SYSU D00476]